VADPIAEVPSTIPVLLLDVDGVLNVRAHTWPCRVARGTATTAGQPWPMRWAPALMARIRALHETGMVEIRWCTTWVGDTGQLSRLFELPTFPDAYAEDDAAEHTWNKLNAALEVVQSGRPLVWVDDFAIPKADDFDAEHRQALEAAGALLIETDHRCGLTPGEMDRIETYCREHTRPELAGEIRG